MLPAEIRAEIVADPAIAALVPDTVAIAAALSANRTKLAPRNITERRIIAALGLVDGDAFLSALEAFTTATLDPAHPLKPYQPGLKRVLSWLRTDEGLDVGDPLAQQMLASLAAVGVVDSAASVTVRALALVPDPVPELEVRRAIFADDGSLLVGA
jgi:hypothetical protein